MTYATQQSMIDRYGSPELIQLTDKVDGLTVNTAVLTVALADADAEINSYLASRYTLPLTQITDEVVRMACDITRYKLHTDNIPATVKDRYDAVIAKLRDISKGVASLGIAQDNAPVATVSSGAQITSGGRDFGRSGRGSW